MYSTYRQYGNRISERDATTLSGFDTILYEGDRVSTTLEFIPTSFNEAFIQELDTISLFFTQRYILLAALLISNFELAPFETRKITKHLSLLTNEGDPERLDQVDNDIILNASKFDEGVRRNIFIRRFNVATHIGDNVDQRHLNIPVFSISNPMVYKSAIIAATLLLEYGEIFQFSQKADHGIESLFSAQLLFLSLLKRSGTLPASHFIQYENRIQKRVLNKQTLSAIVEPLFQADFISREGHLIILTKKQILERKERTVHKKNLLAILADSDFLEISYKDLRERLIELYYTDPHTQTDYKTSAQNVAKYLQRLKDELSITITIRDQASYEQELGHFGLPYKYKLTRRGEEFLERVTNLIEDPAKTLGSPDEYFISAGNRLRRYSEFSQNYKLLIQDQLRSILSLPPGVE